MNTRVADTSIKLGATNRRTYNWRDGDDVEFVDEHSTRYKPVSTAYATALKTKSRYKNVIAFDFKMKRASGKNWPTPPRQHAKIVFYDVFLETTVVATGVVVDVFIGRGRSTGVVTIKQFRNGII